MVIPLTVNTNYSLATSYSNLAAGDILALD